MEYEEFLIILQKAPAFKHEQTNDIPSTSGVYVAWISGDTRCLYVGKAGNLRERIRSHYSGQRGRDQFCLYVYDQFIHNDRPSGLDTRQVNIMTAEWIREKVFFKFGELPSSEIGKYEEYIRKKYQPLLNPL